MSIKDLRRLLFFKNSPPHENSLGWKRNFFIFGLLILVILGYFFWQANKTRQGFIKRSNEHSQMIAGMVSFSLKNSKYSQDAIEKTIHTFLTNTAKFTNYLDSIEPFSAEELAAFAQEAHLSGIKIIRYNEADAEGPPGWSPDVSCQPTKSNLQHYPENSLYLLVWPAADPGCILVGIDSHYTDTLMEQIGLEKLMTDMSQLPLIDYIRLEKSDRDSHFNETSKIQLLKGEKGHVAESRIPFGDHSTLIVGVDAQRYVKRMRQLTEEFSLFSILLIFLGIFFSWIISRYQRAFLVQVRKFERKMAKQHEEASLGRATAIISHEIKNPLNAISMGLQRLQIELTIPDEHENLITSMLQAVTRTSHIINDLKQYSQPISPQKTTISPKELIDNSLILYQEKCEKLGIVVTYHDEFCQTVPADPRLLGQAIENVLKNAIEAQPNGGKIGLRTYQQNSLFFFTIENPGFTLDAQKEKTIMEPYFTSKTEGTGLGLDVSRRIIEAHGGTITLEVPSPKVLRVVITLPIKQKGDNKQ